MSGSTLGWLDELRDAALELCQTVAIINGPPDVRPWNTNQVLWAGDRAPTPAEPIFSYHHLGEHVAILGAESRACLSRFVQHFAQAPEHRAAYGDGFLRDMLVGLLQLSLPDAPITPVPSPYWKRYVAPAVAQLRAGSPERYAEAVVTAVRALPVPHPATIVVLPLAGIHLLATHVVAGVALIPDASCSADPDLAHCGMFLHRLKDLRARADGTPLVFAKLAVPAEPGLAVQRAVSRTEQVCRLLRLLPNPGLADGPLADPPRIDLDASDSAAFYIAETSIGTHPIPVRRTTSEPQGRLGSWRVEPRLHAAGWTRLAAIIERGAATDLEARLLTALRHLGEAAAEPSAASTVVLATDAVLALIGAPQKADKGRALPDLAARVLGVAAGTAAAQLERALELTAELRHDLEHSVSLEERAQAVWLAYRLLEALLDQPALQTYRDLVELPG